MQRTLVVALVLLLALVVGGSCYGYPKYRVWQKELAGQAQLKEAEWNRQITVAEARATRESATELAEAERIRARGVKDANDIIAAGLGGPEGYLRYLWIQTLDDPNNSVIYVPTEANLPIMEATRSMQR